MESEKVYNILKEKIVKLELMPEQVLNISELSQLYNVSRTPIKEALIMLQCDGWVLRNTSNFMVTPLSLNRIKNVTEIRSVLEVKGNIWAMQRITDEELFELNKINKRILKLNKKLSSKEFIELDNKFHTILYKATKNEQLSNMLSHLLSSYHRFWLSLIRETKISPLFNSTVEIIKNIKAKDEAGLKKSTLAHINGSLNTIANFLK